MNHGIEMKHSSAQHGGDFVAQFLIDVFGLVKPRWTNKKNTEWPDLYGITDKPNKKKRSFTFKNKKRPLHARLLQKQIGTCLGFGFRFFFHRHRFHVRQCSQMFFNAFLDPHNVVWMALHRAKIPWKIRIMFSFAVCAQQQQESKTKQNVHDQLDQIVHKRGSGEKKDMFCKFQCF